MSDIVETIEHHVGQEIEWRAGEQDVLVYHYNTDRHKPFIHPLRVGSDTSLTTIEPEDHTWHRGLWFAWKFLNGTNFWEEEEHAGEAAGAGFGSTCFARIQAVLWQAGQVHLTSTYEYRLPAGDNLLRETRTIAIAHPTPGIWSLDWDASFTAQQAVRLDRTVICEATPWGGYAGLSFRAAQTWQDVRGLDSEGRRDTAIEHQRARWVQISGVDPSGRRGGLAMLDHPMNPRYPSYWRYIDEPGFSYINPSLVLAEPYDMAQGEKLHLRYRVIATDGGLDTAALEAQHADFATSATAAGEES